MERFICICLILNNMNYKPLMQKSLEEVMRNLKASDRDAVERVIMHLLSHGLQVSICGSVARGNENYRDVDILVKGPNGKINDALGFIHQVYREYADAYVDRLLHEENPSLRMEKPLVTIQGGEYTVVLSRSVPEAYVSNFIDRRIMLQNGKTLIDISSAVQ